MINELAGRGFQAPGKETIVCSVDPVVNPKRRADLCVDAVSASLK